MGYMKKKMEVERLETRKDKERRRDMRERKEERYIRKK